MFFNRLSHAVSAEASRKVSTGPTFSPESKRKNPLIALAAAMALPAGLLAATRVCAAEAALAAKDLASPSGDGTVVLAADSKMSDADRLKLGQKQLQNKQYDDAVTTLQMVKKDSLNDADKKALDDSLAEANSAAKERAAARAEFEKGQDAFSSQNYNEALTHFKAAKENQFADSATVDKADTQIAATDKVMASAGMDSKSLYKKGREEYRKGDWNAAKRDLMAAQDAGYKPGFLEPSPRELLAKIDAGEKAYMAKANASAEASAAAVASPTTAPSVAAVASTQPSETAVAPAAEEPAKPVNKKAEARAAYLKGRSEYRKGDWDVAREDLNRAKELNYHAGLFEDSPSKILARMDAREKARAAKHPKPEESTPTAVATDVTPTTPETTTPKSEPAPAEPKPEPAPADTTATTTTPPANTTTAATPTAGPSNPAAAEADRQKTNQTTAQDYVDQANAALRAGRKADASRLYGEALARDPQNQEAINGQARLAADAGTPAGDTSHLAQEVQRDIEIRRDRVNQSVNQYLSAADSASARHDFVEAARQIDLARTAVASDNAIFTPSELSSFAARIDTVDKNRAAREAQYRAEQENMTQRRVEEDTRKAQQTATQERERTIRDLINQTQQLIRDSEYQKAMGVVDHILSLDAQNDYARGVRPLLSEKAILQEQRKSREEFDRQFSQTLNSGEEKRIPYDEILRYPTNWPDISEIRDATTRAERGIKDVDTAAQALLERKLPAIDFNGNSFGDVMDFLRDVTNANIFVNWRALETAGITKEAPVTARLKDIKFSKALNTILSDVGGGTVKLSYTIDEGVITISTADDLAKTTATHTYDIRDLLVEVPDFDNAPDLSLLATQTGNNGGGTGGTSGGVGGGGGIGGGGIGGGGGGIGGGGGGLFGNTNGNTNEKTLTRQERVDAIVKLIEETVDPNSWRDNGGQIGAVKELNGQLIVTQTSDNQRLLVNLLEQLRETRAIQITVETRFIQVERHYMEDVGLNLDFFFNTTSPNRFSPITVSNSSSDFTLNPATNIPGSLGTAANAPQSLVLSGTYLDNFQVNLLLRATEATVRSSTVTAPRLTLFNGQRAYVLIATQRAYVSNLTPVVGNGVVAFLPSITTLEAPAVKLDVQATVSSDRKYVTMTLRPQLTTLLDFFTFEFETASSAPVTGNNGGTVSAGAGNGFIQQPEIQLTEVNTTVSVPDGGTLLLGGQTVSGEITKEAGVPVLSKIPFLKRLFTNRSQAKDDVVQLILVRPTIIIQRESEQKQFPLLSTKAPGEQ